MSSPHNQPVVEDIVSAFKTTQNQSWSVFNDKLGNIPINDCKKKANFKSENPIELSVDDISVFGIIPRLEKLILVSCSKCLMIVKKDCLHIHYNRRHSNPNNDTFSLESFIMPNAKANKHKRQKVRKASEKKIITDKNINLIKQEIKTEFDKEIKPEFDQAIKTECYEEIKTEFDLEIKPEFDQKIKTGFDQEIKPEFDQKIKTGFGQEIETEFDQEIETEFDQEIKTEFDQEIKTEFDQEIKTEFDQKINQTKVKQENEIQYVDDKCKVNLMMTSCSPSTSSITCDWNLKPCTQSSVRYADHKVNNRIIETDKKEFHKILSVLPCCNAEEKECLSAVKRESSVDCVISSCELDKNVKDSNEQMKSSMTLSCCMEYLSDNDESKIKNECNGKSNCKLPSVLQNNKEQTRLTTINTYSSNSMNSEHPVNSTSCKRSSISSTSYHKELKRKSNINFRNVAFGRFATARHLNFKEGFKFTQNKKYSDVVYDEDEDEEKDKIKDNSQIIFYQLSSELLSNIEQIFKSSKCNCLNTISDKGFYGFIANSYQSTELSKLKQKIKIEDNYESKDYSKIKFSKFILKLLNNRIQSQFSLSNEYLGVAGNKYYGDTVTNNDYLSTLPFSIKEEINYSENNETVMNNESFDNTITSFDHSSVSLVGVKEESKHSHTAKYLNDKIDYDCYDPKNEYYQQSTGYNNVKALMQRSLCFYHVLNEYKKNNEIIKSCVNNYYSLPPKLQDNEETESTSSSSDVLSSASSDNYFNSYDESSTESLASEKESKPILTNCLGVVDHFENDYYQSSSKLSDNEAQITFLQSPEYQSDICHENSGSSLISYVQSSNIQEDANSSKDICLDFMSDENDSVTSNDNQSNIDLQDIMKETKSTQTNVSFKCINGKQFINPITRIDESIVESFGILNNMSKSTQIDLSLECCLDCHEITEDFLDNYFPIDSNVEVTDFINTPNGSNAQIATDNVVNNFIPVICNAQNAKYPANNFTSVSSNAQIINNTIIPTSMKKYELMDSDVSDHYISNSSNYLSYTKQFPWGTESQNKHLSNRLTHRPIIENNRLLKNYDKIYSSEPYPDKSKQNENVFHRNIINGSTAHMDKNQIICKDHLQKTIIENIRHVNNRNSYSNIEIKSKIKKNLKRRVSGQIADGKENYESTIGCVQKLRRLEFVVRKRPCSDESDNDNVDE